MNWQDLRDRPRFHEHASFDQDIEPERFFPDKALVGYLNRSLFFGRKFSQFKFTEQAPCIDGFGQLICLGKEWVPRPTVLSASAQAETDSAIFP
jgi:hypothetical protein